MSDVLTEDAKPKALGNAAVDSGVVARRTRSEQPSPTEDAVP